MNWLIRFIYFQLFIRIVIRIIIGLNIRNRERMPTKGPAIIIANHNSHLDTMVVMSMMLKQLSIVKPVAAMDYFLKNPFIKWFSLKIIGIVPLKRKKTEENEDLLAPVYESLKQGNILVLFPEGSRGEPEKFQQLKTGIARVSQQMPEVPVVPIYFYGLGKSLPKGEALLVPFFCDVFVGEHLKWTGDKESFMVSVNETFSTLAEQAGNQIW